MTQTARTLLYVEDDPAHTDLVLRTLEIIGARARVVHVADGEAALRYVEEAREADRPALVLLDLRLPRLDGLEVLSVLKGGAHASIPVVVLSTSDADRDVSRAYARKANGYVVKPPRIAELEALLRDVDRFWLRANVTPRGHGDFEG
jgi:CheY-like chemotaxis protein